MVEANLVAFAYLMPDISVDIQAAIERNKAAIIALAAEAEMPAEFLAWLIVKSDGEALLALL